MTTIVCNTDTMAADTRVTWDDESTSLSIKIEKNNEEIFGSAGDIAAGIRFLEWYKAGSKGRKPKVTKDFRMLKLTTSGIFLIDHSLTWVKIDASFYAVGSGAPFAIGAMEMGASPAEAVKIAMKHDSATGGSITVLKLKE